MIGAAGYALVDAGFIAVTAWMLECILASVRWPRRFVWIAAFGLSIALPAWRLAGALPGFSPFEISVPSKDVVLNPRMVPSTASTHRAPARSPSVQGGADATAQAARMVLANTASASWAERVWTASLYRWLQFGFATSWILGSAALFAKLLLSGRHYSRLVQGWPHKNIDGVAVRISEDLGPAVLGILHPRIIVPIWFEHEAIERQRAALTHEMEHLRAHDGRWLWVGVMLTAAFPWNLPLWWQLRRLRLAIEIDCDARALGRGHKATEYGRTLLDVAARMQPGPRGATGVFERHSHLERRLRIIATPRRRWWRYAAIPLYALCALSALAAATLPPPPVDHALGLRNQAYRAKVEVAQQRAEEHRVRARLLANGSPDALAAAAMFMMHRADTVDSSASRARARAGYLGPFIPPDAAERYQWLADSAASAPQRADLAMMELRYCRAWNPRCDLAALRRRLLALDPANGAVWLDNLDRAYEKHDAAGIDAALTRIAESQRVDSFGTRLVPVLFHAMHDLGGASATDSYEWATEAASGGMADLEAMIAIENACTTNARGIPADRTKVCRGVALALEHGDNLLYAQVGYNLAMRLWSDETPEGLLARAGKRRLDYLEQASAKRPWPNPLNLVLGSERYFWLVNEPVLRAETHYPREQDVWRAVLMNEGINPDPPKTWQDQRIRGSQDETGRQERGALLRHGLR